MGRDTEQLRNGESVEGYSERCLETALEEDSGD